MTKTTSKTRIGQAEPPDGRLTRQRRRAHFRYGGGGLVVPGSAESHPWRLGSAAGAQMRLAAWLPRLSPGDLAGRIGIHSAASAPLLRLRAGGDGSLDSGHQEFPRDGQL